MSIDNNSECVRSKYFTGETAMDESLSDFQETKKSCKGPKPSQKASKPKTRKVSKRIKGQKDIRAALKGKKNELELYSKEFDTVCKKSGLGVDSEQLQLAIALSKSLQTESESSSDNSQPLSSQDRVSKIRRTLQEYGFKVPEAKITSNKRTRKHRKHYKLLTISEEERQQGITGKYSQILFQNCDYSKINENIVTHLNCSDKVIYVATNAFYECMKDNSIFYVNNLIEKSFTSGSLLRDWSEIPGRPLSPNQFDTNTMDFANIECSQDELDVILSGPINTAKDIIARKQKEYKSTNVIPNVPDITIDVDDEKVEQRNGCSFKSNENNIEIGTPFKKAFKVKSPNKQSPKTKMLKEDVSEIQSYNKNYIDSEKKVIDVEVYNKLTIAQPCRSCSPDIFDDIDEEITTIIETPVNILSQENKTKVFIEDNFMDLTHCANTLSQKSEKSIQLSQNITKRKSNDFMEMTECIIGSSQPIHEGFKDIYLTESPEEKTVQAENHVNYVSEILSLNNVDQYDNDSVIENVIKENNGTVVINLPEGGKRELEKENIDLTQSSNEEDGRVEENNSKKEKNDEKFQSMDLTQSSNSNDTDELPVVDFGHSQTEKSLDDTIILHADEYLGPNGIVKKSMIFENVSKNEVYDLTQEVEREEVKENLNPIMKTNIELCSNSFYEDFLHDHSENTENSRENSHISTEDNREPSDIDLTQGSDSNEDNVEYPRPVTVTENIPRNSSLGKRGDVSIDYDEIEDSAIDFLDKENENDDSFKLKYDSPNSNVDKDVEIIDANNEQDTNSSQNSEVFHISDKELDYSLHKSRHVAPRDNFDFGGISVLDNVSKLSFRKSLSDSNIGNRNNTMADTFLPEVDIKGVNTQPVQTENKITEISSPLKLQDILNSETGVLKMKTPKNSEYIIKTNNVTPMLDYASMSTPQRNRELDKYGLKPFKRKRAIQILTHIYNQTHPTIQQLVEEDQSSPSKKPRHENTTASPKKFIKSPRNSPLKKNSPSKCLGTPKKGGSSRADVEIMCSQTSKAVKVVKENVPEQMPTGAKELDEVCSYEVTSEVAVIKGVDCDPDDWVFQKREKAKVHSCRVPLHIAFHNYVLSRRSLREAILKYEPVNIDVIHKDLVGYGHRYDPKDLLKFLDKKCITVKTTDNNARNNRR